MPTPRTFVALPGARCLRAALLAGAAVLAPAVARAQGPFSSLTFFGDSYVDTGNAFLLTGGAEAASPPYFQGRFSNGLVFTDYLAQQLGRPADAAPVVGPNFVTGNYPASGNYAIGGARTNNLQGTSLQLGAYLGRPGTTPATLTDPTGLYTLFVGGNDLRDIGDITDPAARQAAAIAAAQRVVAQAGLLAGAGARNVLLFTLASPGVMPEALGVPGLSASRDQATVAFNSALALGIATLQPTLPGTTFLNFRLDNLYANILADARAGGGLYGLTNFTTACFAPGAPSCDVSVFSDAIHPTTRTHQIIGSAIYTYVTTGRNVAVIPEPATLALVAGGLATLGAAAAARRRAA